MAKKKQVFIEVIVDDKGTTQKLAVDANKLEKALVGQNKQTKDADRALRGAANMSSNTTKNFSKMTQGINGGIVPAYAELAARVFAVTAAFRFLQEAADTRNLISGQQAFGALMGTNYAGITKALQDATDGQLRFSEAAQATAIGTAAGLTQKQLTGLATAAKNVSFALGRDLTDSFNRLIRGVTKAEPELLDELGIILRLEPATQEYAASIGKTAKSLTAFERSQAVANFVLTEAERKFARIAEITDKDAFAVAQFGKAFDDVLNQVKVTLANVLTPVLKFLTANVNSLIGALGLLALPLVRSVLPNLDQFADNAKNAATAAKKFSEAAQKDFDALSARAAVLGKSTKDLADQAGKMTKAAGLKGDGAGPNTAKGFLSAGEGDPLSARGKAAADKALKGAEKQLINSEKVKTGILKGFNAQQVADLRTSYKLRERILKGHEVQVKRSVAGMKISFDKFLAGVQLKSAKAFGFMATQAKRAAKGIDLAFKGIGFIGFALLIADLGKMAFDALFPISEEAKKAKDKIGDLASTTEELVRHLSDVNDLANDSSFQLTYVESIQQFGNAVKQANVPDLIRNIGRLDELGKTAGKNSEEFKKLEAGLKATVVELGKMDPAFNALMNTSGGLAKLTDEEKRAILARNEELIKAGDAVTQLTDAQKALNAEITNITSAVPKAPLQSLIAAFDKELELQITIEEEGARAALKRTLDKLDKDIAEAERRRSGIEEKTVTITTGGGSKKRTRQVTRSVAVQTQADRDAIAALRKKRALEQETFDKREVANKEESAIRKQLVNLAQQQLDREDRILELKNSVALIDKVSKSFDAQRVRAIIPIANAQQKVLAAKNKELSADAALLALKKKGKNASEDDIKNATRAQEIARENTRIAENEFDQKMKAFQIDQLRITAAQKQLEIQREINGINNALNAAQQLQQRRQTGFGSIGANIDTLNQEKSASVIENAQARILALTQQINLEETKRATAVAEQNQGEIDRINQAQQALALQILQQNILIEGEANKVAILTQSLELENQIKQRKIEAISLNPVQQALDLHLLENGLQRKDLSEEELALLEQKISKSQELDIVQKGLAGLRDSITNGMESAFMSIIDGSKSAKQAFADFAKQVLAQIAKMVIQMLIFKALSGPLGGLFGNGGIATPPPGARYGGVLQARRGGMFQDYSTGGIARGRQAGYPAILHGTEAVVPLPNKKEIPVDLKGGTGNVNNISITVNSDGTSRQEGASGTEQSKQLGKAISAAVQEELHKQKRPGGILSPYGAA